MRARLLARKIAELALTKKAQDVVIMDLRGLTSMADFFVVCSADSEVQMRAIADAVEDGIEKKGSAPWHRESGSANWVLLDFVDVVVHVFHKGTRAFYNLEKLWGDARINRWRTPRRPSSSALARRAASRPRHTPGFAEKLASS